MPKFLRWASALVTLLIAASVDRGGPCEGPPHLVSGRRDWLRPGARIGPVLEHRQRSHFRAASDVRLSRASRKARSDDRRVDAGSVRGRPHVHRASEARHLFRARSRIQGPAARVDRGRLRLRVQALCRPGEPCAVRCSCSRARSSVSTSRRRRRRSPASSTTTRRSPVSSRSTSTRFASSSRARISCSLTRSPTSRSAQSRAKSSRRTANDVQAHPVGTGPYTLKEWRRAAKIMLEANPNYREVIWNFQAEDDAGTRRSPPG